ncbi:hypothetical protein CB0940_05225 [Cercospora beticola]|uniref:Zn(2)-C6 fungal-type domain-containing protein n=1 Tax=Cercospora beticola TaxID=122368 RepID=A0A2G5HKR7_CERBT|nr:hypothetical protein CB0940_05225 [Cercospora beticola]PIA93161.1 hypothetical protein CB0940_05225 [Cercospora beticola]WPB02544.1 hypothetical protein RHO25_007180 [Cercospora beticola]CAK1362563.1 unnamed protein product [Cercospora beticola]
MASSVLPKACRNCRLRKIRCDKKYPCSSCQTSGIECQRSSNSIALPSAQPYPSPPPAALSTVDAQGLARNIEQINNAVQQLLTLQTKSTGSHTSPHPLFAEDYAAEQTEPTELHDSDAEIHEGVSSFNAQALIAGEASQALAGGHDQLVAAQEGLRSLRQLVSDGSPALSDGASPRAHHQASHASFAKSLNLLPIEVVLQVVKVFKTHVSSVVLPYGMPGLDYLESACRAAYFPTEPLSPGQIAVMHGMLYYLLWEWMSRDDIPAPGNIDFDAMMKLSESNFELALRTYDVLAYATQDNAMALYFAAIKAREHSNVKRAWSYASCAARHLLNMGLHRRSTLAGLSSAQRRERLILFWNIYGLEKSLALTLGHTATLRDDDIDADPVPVNQDPRYRDWDEVPNLGARLGRVEGQIFDRLYTASALNKKSEERIQIVHELSQALEECLFSFRARSDECIFPDIYDFAFGDTNHVAYYSLLTTLHRGTYATSTSPGIITHACYDAARKCLQAHLAIIEQVRLFRGGQLTQNYLTWALQYGAFTPLIVVFLHSLSDLDEQDLALLQRFHDSLLDVPKMTEGTRKLRTTCAIFISVAKVYVESRPGGDSNSSAQHTSNNANTSNLPTTTLAPNAEIVQRQQIQEAFDRTTQVIGNSSNDASQQQHPQSTNPQLQSFPAWEPGLGDLTQIDEMSAFMDNWMDGSQQAADLFSVDFGGGPSSYVV